MNDPIDIAPREYRGPTKRIHKGLLIVYTGEGKGKSTAAFGAVLRSLGRGFKVAIVQFIKGPWVSGEVKALEKFGSQVEFHTVGEGFTWDTQDLERDKACARQGWNKCLSLLKEGRHQVYVFDELLYVLKYRFLEIDDVIAGLSFKKVDCHVILTGQAAPPRLVEMADLVTEMKEIKHPFKHGITAQPGIDY